MPETSAPISSSGTPQAEYAAWVGAWSGDTDEQRENVLEALSATIDYAFNVRDADGDCGSLLEDAVIAAAMFIESQPCTCTDDPCPRCLALNRWHDVRNDR